MANEHPVVPGFRFAGVASGIKPEGALDLALMMSDAACPAAAVFTRNRVKAAPVLLASERIELGRAQAVLVNSGTANACTGPDGMDAARTTTEALAGQLRIDDSLVLPASTGIIGKLLPADKVVAAIPRLVEDLSADGVERFARAIMTTDQWPKIASVQFAAGRGDPATVLGIAKGAGMVHPDMATTLGFVATDLPMTTVFLQESLRHAVDRTFNCLSVDGETSTNDTLVAMASGKVDTPPLKGSAREARTFADALADVLGELAKSIARDGEGAQHLVRVEVVGAPSDATARQVARRIASSLLVKTAIHGCDPNWGRIVAASGTAGVVFKTEDVDIRVGDIPLVRKGVAVGGRADEEARKVMQGPEYTITVALGTSSGKGHYWTCDLGPAYVQLNAGHRT